MHDLRKILVLSGALLLCAAVASAMADELRLSPGEEVSVSVFGNEDITGTYRVRADGTVSMHLLEPIPAAGLTLEELESAIEDRLRQTNVQITSVVVDVVEYLPVYVAGAVETPGSFPYRPRLTAEQAVAMAGGAFRGGSDAFGTALQLHRLRIELDDERVLLSQSLVLQAGIDLLDTRPDAATLALDEARALLRDVQFGEETGFKEFQELNISILTAEQEIVAARSVLNERLAASATLERDAFRQQLAELGAEVARIEERLAETNRLLERGLSVSARSDTLQLQLSAARASINASIAQGANAEQTLAQAEAEAKRAIEQATIDRRRQRLDLQGTIRRLRASVSRNESFLRAFGAGTGDEADLADPLDTRFVIRRGTQTLTGAGTTPLLPGDVVYRLAQ